MSIKFSEKCAKKAHSCIQEHLSQPLEHATSKGLRTLQNETALNCSEGVQIWSIDLDGAAGDQIFSKAKPGEWRFLLFQNEEAIAEAQVQDHTGETLASSVSHGPTTAGLVNALLVAEELETDGEFEPRLLHISAIKFVGLWLHCKANDSKDFVIPMPPSFTEFENLNPVGKNEFESIVQSAAASEKELIGGMSDDFGGSGAVDLGTATHGPVPSSMNLKSLALKAATGMKAGAVRAKSLPNFMERQKQTNWCWAAVGTSVGRFFKTGNWSQCSTATGCLPGQNCCLNAGPCNVYGFLDKSLKFTHSFDSSQGGTTPLSNVESNINANKPVCTRVAWTGGGAHFMAISGYNGNSITIQDPIFGTTTMPYGNYPASYQSGGSWTTTYFCKPGTSTSFESFAFPGVSLRMDGGGVVKPTGPGGGTVNCQFGVGSFEKLYIVPQPDGTSAIMASNFPGIYLRMDGNGVTSATGPGGGNVNCQFSVGSYEKFKLEPQPDGTTAIASVQFPGVYLRMDGNGVKSPTGPGGGNVNCQFGVGSYEKFHLRTHTP